MTKIRKNVFETNSSSCHTITLGEKESFEKLRSHKYIYTQNLEHHDDYRDYYAELDNKYIRPIEEVFKDIGEALEKANGCKSYITEALDKYEELKNSNPSEDELYEFIMCERWSYEEYLPYEISDTDYILALNKNLEEESSKEHDSYLEEEYYPVDSNNSDKIIRKVMVWC